METIYSKKQIDIVLPHITDLNSKEREKKFTFSLKKDDRGNQNESATEVQSSMHTKRLLKSPLKKVILLQRPKSSRNECLKPRCKFCRCAIKEKPQRQSTLKTNKRKLTTSKMVQHALNKKCTVTLVRRDFIERLVTEDTRNNPSGRDLVKHALNTKCTVALIRQNHIERLVTADTRKKLPVSTLIRNALNNRCTVVLLRRNDIESLVASQNSINSQYNIPWSSHVGEKILMIQGNLWLADLQGNNSVDGVVAGETQQTSDFEKMEPVIDPILQTMLTAYRETYKEPKQRKASKKNRSKKSSEKNGDSEVDETPQLPRWFNCRTNLF